MWQKAVEQCCDQLNALPDDVTLGIVYVSDPFTEALDHIAERLSEATGIDQWVGTGAHGVCANGRERYGTPGIVVMAMAIAPEAFQLFDGVPPGGPRMVRAGGLAVVHADTRQPRGAQAIADLGTSSGAFLVGGLGSSRISGLQIAGGPVEGGLSGVLFSDAVSVVTGLTQGCTPIGPVHEVTGSFRNRVARLGGRPAVDVLREEVGEIFAGRLDRMLGYIHAALPVAGADRSDYLVRSLLGINEERGELAINDDVAQGASLMFVRRDGASAQADMARMLAEIDTRRDKRPIKGALYHVCVGRGPHAFGPDSRELGMIRDVLGDVPLIGFFADGEIHHDRLYAYTGVLTLFV